MNTIIWPDGIETPQGVTVDDIINHLTWLYLESPEQPMEYRKECLAIWKQTFNTEMNL